MARNYTKMKLATRRRISLKDERTRNRKARETGIDQRVSTV